MGKTCYPAQCHVKSVRFVIKSCQLDVVLQNADVDPLGNFPFLFLRTFLELHDLLELRYETDRYLIEHRITVSN